MKRKIIYLLLSFLPICVIAQSRYAADRYFEEFNYPKAAELYTLIHKKGDNSKLLLSRLADSYYFNTQTEDAEKWYKLLIEKHKDVSSEYLFRFAQTLKSNNKYDLSDKIMKQLDVLDEFDSRSDQLDNKPDYYEIYSKESGDVLNLNNVSTNTKYSDFGGFGINNRFYYSSSTPLENVKENLYNWNHQPFLNLYKAKSVLTKNNTIDLEDPIALDSPIQTHYHEANAVITKKGRKKVMYFTRDNYDGKNTGTSSKKDVNLKLYRAIRENGLWGNIVELPFNNNEYSLGHPALSPDEKTLYFVSNMPGGYGSTDIYKVDILPGNNYSTPINLGPEINTEGREMFPYVSSDNTLFFSSDGHLGLGALDVFEVEINRDNTFGKVLNLKAPFNSNLDDFGFWINEDYTKGFFTSNRKGGKGDDDIYSFILNRPNRSNKVIKSLDTKAKFNNNISLNDDECRQFINGLVTEKRTNKIMPNTIVKLLDENGKVIHQTVSDIHGLYTFTVACQTNYKVLATSIDHRSDFKAVFTTPETNFNNRADLSLIGLIVDNQIKLNPIYFDLDKSFIRADAEYELENIVTVMRNHPEMKIRIESHTDSRASKQYNKKLSQRRAESTKSYLVSRGISYSRIISAVGYGEDKLLNRCNDANATKCSEVEHQLNRRSYFYIVGNEADLRRVENRNSKITYNSSKANTSYTPKNELNNTSLTHKVKPNETVYSITKMYNITKEELILLNKHLPKLKNNLIFVNDILKVRTNQND